MQIHELMRKTGLVIWGANHARHLQIMDHLALRCWGHNPTVLPGARLSSAATPQMLVRLCLWGLFLTSSYFCASVHNKNLDQLYSSLNHHTTTSNLPYHVQLERGQCRPSSEPNDPTSSISRVWQRNDLVCLEGVLGSGWYFGPRIKLAHLPGSYLILSKTFEGLSGWAENRAVSAVGGQKKIEQFAGRRK